MHFPARCNAHLLRSKRAFLLEDFCLLIRNILIRLRSLAWLIAMAERRQGRIFLQLLRLEIILVRLVLTLGFALQLVGNGTLILCIRQSYIDRIWVYALGSFALWLFSLPSWKRSAWRLGSSAGGLRWSPASYTPEEPTLEVMIGFWLGFVSILCL